MGSKKLVLKPSQKNYRLYATTPLKEQSEIISALEAGKNILVEGPDFSGKSVVLQLCLNTFVEKAKKAGKKHIYRKVWGIAPNRYRVDNLNLSPVIVDGGLGRLFRTPAGMAFAILEDYFKKAHPELPNPRLFTGDQEAAKIAEIIAEHKPEWKNIPNLDSLQATVLEQLRNLYDTCAQWGLSSYDLDILGQYLGRADWCEAANKVFTYYQPKETDKHWNQSSLQARSIDILRNWHDPNITNHGLTLPDLLLVEDLQDMPACTAQLIYALAGAGVQVVAVSNPNMAVENYRGGNAENQRILLEGEQYSELLKEILAIPENDTNTAKQDNSKVSFFHFKLPQRRNKIEINGKLEEHEDIPLELEFLSANNADNLFRNIAIELRKRHVLKDIPWDDMVVICRNQRQVQEYREGLENYDIPISQTQHSLVFKTHFATGPLLNIFYYAQLLEELETGADLDESSRKPIFNSIFSSDYLNIDNYQICKLKQGFEALNIGRIRQQNDFKCQSLEQFLDTVGTVAYRPKMLPNLEAIMIEIDRLHRWVWQARQYLQLNPLEAIDRLWQETNLADKWRQLAIEGDKYFDEALDGINALYAHAKSWQEGYPEAQLKDYLQVLDQQTGPVDTLAKLGQSGPGIQVLSFAVAAGRIFDTVVVAGVQEGSWPNPTIRNQLFTSGEIRDLGTGRAVFSSTEKVGFKQVLQGKNENTPRTIVKDWRAERKAVVQDEQTLFESSCARAENKLYLAAIEGDEDRPSIFYYRLRKKYPKAKVKIITTHDQTEFKDTLDKLGGEATAAQNPEYNPATLRESVGQLRQLIIKDSENAQDYARVISVLGKIGVQSAVPENWRHYGGATQTEFYSAVETPIIVADRKVSISPSRLSALMNCPLRSFLEQYQGSGENTEAILVGTALHMVAEKMIDSCPEERRKAFFDILPEPQNNWIDQARYQQYEDMVTRLNYYLDNTKNRKLLAVEKSYRVEVAKNTVLNLRIDRMEEIEGKTHIVDFKTGKSITTPQALENPQLGCYQLAVQETDIEAKISGAALVYLSEHTARMPNEIPKELSQPPLTEDEAENLRKALVGSAQIMKRPYLVAVKNSSCQFCKLKKTCPVSGEGAQLW